METEMLAITQFSANHCCLFIWEKRPFLSSVLLIQLHSEAGLLTLLSPGELGVHVARQAHAPSECLALKNATPSSATQKFFSHVSKHLILSSPHLSWESYLTVSWE